MTMELREQEGAPMKSSRMTIYILAAMVLGIGAGGLIHTEFADPAPRAAGPAGAAQPLLYAPRNNIGVRRA